MARRSRWRRFPSRRPLTGGRLQRVPRPPVLPSPPSSTAGARPRRAVDLGWRRRGRGGVEQVSGGSGAPRAGLPCSRRALPVGGSRQPALGRGAARLRRVGERPPVRARSALSTHRSSAARRCPLAAFACALSTSLLPRCAQVGAERCSGRKRRGCGAAGSSAARRRRGPGGTLRGVLWVSFCLLHCALTHLRFS